MKVRSRAAEFEKRLQELTSTEEGLYFTPFDFSSKPFHGTFSSSTFCLKKNSFFRHAQVFVIEGSYRKTNNGFTEVDYKIYIPKSFQIVSVIVFVFLFFAINTFIYSLNRGDTFNLFIGLNGFLLFTVLWSRLIIFFNKKIVNEKFRTEFEIQN